MTIAPKNWKEFQHYKDRAPQWIKLHKRLLDDFEYACLPVASKALAPMLWLLASEYEDGVITISMNAVAFRLRMTVAELENSLKPLVASGFFITDSDLLAAGYQPASLEKEKEKEKELEEDGAIALLPEKPTKEKRTRRAAEIPLPPSEGIPVAYREHAKLQGVMGAAAEREWRKFRDHAEQKDRRCAGERGWLAAWRGWITKAIEWSPEIVTAPASAPVSRETQERAWGVYLERKRDGKALPQSVREADIPADFLAKWETENPLPKQERMMG